MQLADLNLAALARLGFDTERRYNPTLREDIYSPGDYPNPHWVLHGDDLGVLTLNISFHIDDRSDMAKLRQVIEAITGTKPPE